MFVPDLSNNLIAGIDIGWVSKTHDFSIGFIVGVPFNVLAGGFNFLQ
jgi:hypothetical protein